MKTIKTYLKENFFLPFFTSGRRKISEEKYKGIFQQKGQMSNLERNKFFDEAYGEILFDLFVAWTQTDSKDVSEREHIYRTTLSLGSLREKLISYETFAKNIPYLYEDKEEEDYKE